MTTRASASPAPAALKAAVFALFLASGFSGLVFQVVWVRMLTTVFGVSAYAIGTVLSAFMGGLALGSWLFGRWIDRRGRPLLWYSGLEAGIAVYALAVPLLFRLAQSAFQEVYDATDGTGTALSVVRAGLSIAILIVPTTFMGATLPVLCKFFIDALDRVGRETGRLYFINTIGAVLGCATAGFLLIPAVGLRNATLVAAGINLTVALTAFVLDRAVGRPVGPPRATETIPAPAARPLAHRWVLVAFAMSGFAALFFEVIWSRVLIMIFGSTVYSFSAMLSVFLLGIALGSVLFGWTGDRFGSPLVQFAFLEIAIALVVVLEVAAINHLPYVFMRVLQSAGFTYEALTLVKFGMSFAVLFPATILFGGTFPLISKLYTDDLGRTGRSIGTVYAMNTLGAILGSLFGGFFLLPALGMRSSLLLAGWVVLSVGVVSLVLASSRGARRIVAAATVTAAFLLATLAVPEWNKTLLSLGVYYQPKSYVGPDGAVSLRSVVRDTTNLYYAEGLNDTIIVNQNPAERVLSVNGKIVASSGREDMLIQMMLGHLPILVHPGIPRSAMNIGMGTGTSVGSLAAYPFMERVDCLELEPKVPGGTALFAEENLRALDNPRLNLIIADGRNHLTMTEETYDIISSDPFHPYMTGAGNLYAKEHFENGRRHLNPGGVMSQWLPAYQLDVAEFGSVVATFAEVFPHASVWFSGTSVILIGSEEPIRLDPETMHRKIEESPLLRQVLDDYGLGTPERLLSFLLADESTLGGYVSRYTINTDANPFVEYSAPRSIFLNTTGPNLGALQPFFLPAEGVLDYVIDAVPSERFDADRAVELAEARREGIQGYLDYYRGDVGGGLDRLAESMRRSEDPITSFWLALAHETYAGGAQAAGRIDVAIPHYEAALAAHPRPTTLVNLGYLYYVTGQLEKGLPLLERARTLNPGNTTVTVRTAAALSDAGEVERAEALYRQALDYEPDSPMVLSMYALHRRSHGDPVGAAKLFEAAIASDPSNLDARDLLAQTYLDLGRTHDAEGACAEIVTRSPASSIGHLCAGNVRLARGDARGSAESFRRAVEVEPGAPLPRFELARALALEGDAEGARASLEKAIDLGGPPFLARAQADPAIAPLLGGSGGPASRR